jgi:hypothetical protein
MPTCSVCGIYTRSAEPVRPMHFVWHTYDCQHMYREDCWWGEISPDGNMNRNYTNMKPKSQ